MLGRRNSFGPFVWVICAFVFFTAPTSAEAANRYWVGSSGGNWNDTANWASADPASCTGGGSSVPGSSDIAIFDDDCDNDATMNTTINVAGITINSGYSGTVSPSSSISITIGASAFVQAGGTFSGGSATIALNGNFTLSGGTFTSTSGTMTILSNLGTFTQSGGTFNHNSGTIYLQDGSGSAGSFSVDVATTITFYNLIFYPKDGGRTLTIASGDTLVTLGTFTQMNGMIETGTIEPRGNVVLNASYLDILGTGTISFLTSGDQTITGNGGSTSNLVVNKSSGTVNAGSTNLYVRSFTLSSGTFVSTSGTMIVCTSFTHTAGGTFTHNSGTVQFGSIGTNCGTGGTVDVATSETFYNLTSSTKDAGRTNTIASGDTLIVTNTFTITAGIFDTGTIEAQGNVVIGASSGGGTASLTFSGTANQTYTDGGTDMTGTVTVNKTSGTVTLAQNTSWNTSGQDLAITSGTLSLAGYNLTVNDQLTIGASGTLQLRGSETITGGPDTVTTGATVIFTGDGDTAADTYTITSYLSASFKNLTINSTDGATDTFQLGAALTVAGNLLLSAGTFDASASNYQINVSGTWEKEAATFTPRSGTVVLNGTSQTMSGSTTFYNFTKSVSSADTLTFYRGTTQTITNTLTMNGAASNLLMLRSSDTGTRWNIDPQGTRTVSYLDVQDSENVNATIIEPGTGSISSGNNVAWNFDSTAPILQSFTTPTADGTYGPGTAVEIVATYDETLASGSTVTVVLDNGQSVVLNARNGATLSGTYTVGATGSGQDSADLTIASITSESVTDAYANTRTDSSVPSGASNLGGSKNIVIDTTAPTTPAVPDLATASDSGTSSTDNITSDNTPTFAIGSCTDGLTVTLSGASLTATGTCASGTVNITTSSLSDGTYSFKSFQTDAAGNISAQSSSLSITVDTAAPSASGTPDLATASDSGTSSTDNITNDTTPTFTVASCTDGLTVTLSGASLTATGTCASGTVNITTSSLSDGTYSFKSFQTDAAGNISAQSSSLSITVDTAAPSASGTPDLATASDSGTSSTDNITSDNTPTFAIGSCTDGLTVTLSGASLTATGTCASGTVDITAASLSDGTYAFTSFQTDVTGNPSAQSSSLSVTVDTTDPILAEVTPVPTPSTDTTPSYVFSSTEAATISFGGSCTSSTTAATLGSNSIEFATLAIGSYSDCTVTATDDAGNASAALSVTAFTIEAPAASSSSSSSSEGNAQGGGGGRGTAGPGGRSDNSRLVREMFLRRFERQVASDEEIIPPISGSSSSSSSSHSSRSSRPTVVEGNSSSAGFVVTEKRGHLEISENGIAVLYKDVPMDAWFTPYISFLIEEDIAQGYKDEVGKVKGEFGVQNAVTYAELAKMVTQASHKDLKTGATPRNMTARGTWASPFIALAEDLHFTVFVPTLDIMQPATRGEVIQTILEAFAIPIGNQKASFSDVPADHANTAAIAVAGFYGLVDGDTNPDGTPTGTFRPNDNINRAEVAKIIALALKLLK